MIESHRVVFFGTPDFAVPALRALLKSGREVSLVVTQPDRPAGRGRKLKMPAVKRFALKHDLPVIAPTRLKDPEVLPSIQEAGAKVFVVAAYGRILPKAILDLAPALNVHASLLPAWRGAAPIVRAIWAGDRETGVSIMRLVQALDAGDVLLQKRLSIGADETTGELSQRLSELGAEALIESLGLLDQGRAVFSPQDDRVASYAHMLEAKEGRISWEASAQEIHNQVRAMNPQPGAYTTDGRQRIKLYRTARSQEGRSDARPGRPKATKRKLWIACGDEWLEILELQKEGKTRQGAADFLSGYHALENVRWR